MHVVHEQECRRIGDTFCQTWCRPTVDLQRDPVTQVWAIGPDGTAERRELRGVRPVRVDEIPNHLCVQYDTVVQDFSKVAMRELGLVLSPASANDEAVLVVLAQLGYASTYYAGTKSQYDRAIASHDLASLKNAITRVEALLSVDARQPERAPLGLTCAYELAEGEWVEEAKAEKKEKKLEKSTFGKEGAA